MKEMFDGISYSCSKLITKTYSTSFAAGIFFLDKRLHRPLYSVYAFVRLADEIVDSFEGYDKKVLLERFRNDTAHAIASKISLNPVLNLFQKSVHTYKIDNDLIETFLNSMEMDLKQHDYSRYDFDQYILGSAEVVGLMCLRVFTENNDELYQHLKPMAMKLGAAFQKVNFLRDMQDDYKVLNRMYFPQINFNSFSEKDKAAIENEIRNDFSEALDGIKLLPPSSRLGVYIAYRYYKALLSKISRLSANRIKEERVRVGNDKKFRLMIHSCLQHHLNLI
ncbi:MAG: phytoene/squalene synthase family protein [Chitinophagales bacterium]